MSMARKDNTLPKTSRYIAVEEFIDLTGISPEHLNEIISLGWIEATTSATQARIFHDTDVYRVRKLERICCDLEIPVIGGTIIVDLLEKVDMLERMVRELHNLD